MDFTSATSNQWEGGDPIELDLKEITQAEAEQILQEVVERDEELAACLFGPVQGNPGQQRL